MDLKEIIIKRRSIRKYKPDPVPQEILDEIFDIALWAPSGMNRQNWHFVVAGKDLRDKIVDICYKAYLSYIGKKVEDVFKHKPEVIKETRSFFATLGGAPVVIFAYAEPGPESPLTDIQTVAAAIQNLLLVAFEKGLGTCWMTGPLCMEEEFNRLLGVEGKKLIALITLGYPVESPKPPPRRKNKVVYLGFDG